VTSPAALVKKKIKFISGNDVIFVYAFVLFVIIGSMFHGYQQTYQKPVVENIDVYVFIAALCMALSENPAYVIVGILASVVICRFGVFSLVFFMGVTEKLDTKISWYPPPLTTQKFLQ
jgi:hypothetical protein